MKRSHQLISIGVVAFVLGVLATLFTAEHLWDKQRGVVDAVDAKRKLVQEYTKQEAKRLGLDCGGVKNQLIEFVQLKVQPVIESYKDGRDWKSLLSAELMRETQKTRDVVFDCNRLYALGEKGTLNELQDLDVLDSVLPLVARLGRILSFDIAADCDSSCAEKGFSEIVELRRKIIELMTEKK